MGLNFSDGGGRSDERSNLTVEEPLIRLYAENANLTAEEARRVAMRLNNAAYRLDFIRGGGPWAL